MPLARTTAISHTTAIRSNHSRYRHHVNTQLYREPILQPILFAYVESTTEVLNTHLECIYFAG